MNNMNKRLKTTAFALLAITLSPIALGDTVGTLNLTGNVPVVLELSVGGHSEAATLTPAGNISGVSIGTVVEKCNDADGYTVTVSSNNGVAQSVSGGLLIGDSVGEQLIYDLTYGGVNVVFSNGTATVSDSAEKTPADGYTNAVLISYDGTSSNLAADSYSDTLTFTIAAK